MSEQETEFDPTGFLREATELPGVYVFYDCDDKVLYVGKARNLKKRLQSYFRTTGLSPKTSLMVSKIARAETQQTSTESEALLLENNLIKDRRPRYNISLRDDKSFPYIRLSNQDRYPRFSFYRGARSAPGKYFGPYPNAAAVREMLGHIHKIFQLRQCTDAFFRNRSRPCLQYQIKRCSAPCVNKIEPGAYAEDVRQAQAMLEGHDAVLMDELAEKMEIASESLNYETAAIYRDRIGLLQRVREQQFVSSDSKDADVVAAVVESGLVCFGVVSIRQGRNLGIRFYIQPNALDKSAAEMLEAFLPQHYLGSAIPTEILTTEAVESRASLQQLFSVESHRKVEVRHNVRSHRARWIESARINTSDHLRRHLNEKDQIDAQFTALADLIDLEEIPSRVECFDISHTMGERTVGSCVVFDQQGAVKSEYRRFNVTGIEPGDDYAAMQQVLTRRYKRVMENDGKLPDLVIIDGGKGQLGIAESVFDELQLSDSVTLMSVSKGPERKSGEETYFLSGKGRAVKPPGTSPASHIVQRIRDEAHRFAITGHRQRRSTARTQSPLEIIEGVGAKRRRELLRYFGGLQEVQRAGVDDLAKVPGISPMLARKIYEHFH